MNSFVFMSIGYKLVTYEKNNKDVKLGLVNHSKLHILCIM